MPTGPGGYYVPIDWTVAEKIFNYFANAQRQGLMSKKDIVKEAFQRFGVSGGRVNLDNRDFIAVQGIFNQADRFNSWGRAATNSPGQAPGKQYLPRIPGDFSHAGEIKYDVLVVGIDPNTGATLFTNRTEIYSLLALSGNDVANTINSQKQQFMSFRTSPKPTKNQVQQADIQVTILGVGVVN